MSNWNSNRELCVRPFTQFLSHFNGDLAKTDQIRQKTGAGNRPKIVNLCQKVTNFDTKMVQERSKIANSWSRNLDQIKEPWTKRLNLEIGPTMANAWSENDQKLITCAFLHHYPPLSPTRARPCNAAQRLTAPGGTTLVTQATWLAT